MALIAADENNPPELRVRMFAELASTRKAVENTGRDGEPIAVKRAIGVSFEEV
jgi:hypothetical protein